MIAYCVTALIDYVLHATCVLIDLVWHACAVDSNARGAIREEGTAATRVICAQCRGEPLAKVQPASLCGLVS